jgi:plastocyanin
MRTIYTRRAGLAALGATAVLLAGCTQLTGNANVNTNANVNANVNQAAANTNSNANINGNTNTGAGVNVNVGANVNANVNVGGSMTKGETKSFTVETANFSFSLKEIKVKKGDTVKIKLVNKEGFHDMRIDEFGIATPKLNGEGQTADIEFVAGKTGTFEYYCSVGQHRAMGMVGKLIVE